MKVKITNVRWADQEGHPMLKFELNGRPASAMLEQKPYLTRQGLVVFGMDDIEVQLANPTPTIPIPDDPAEGIAGFNLKNAFRSQAMVRRLQTLGRAIAAGEYEDGKSAGPDLEAEIP